MEKQDQDNHKEEDFFPRKSSRQKKANKYIQWISFENLLENVWFCQVLMIQKLFYTVTKN